MASFVGQAKDIIAFLTSNNIDQDAMWDLTIHKKKRSLSSNAYYWQLLEKIAVKTHETKAKLHNLNLRTLGLVQRVEDKPVYTLIPDTVEAENEALNARVQVLEKVNEGFIAVKDPYADLKRENEELKEQLEYLHQKLFDLYGIPAELLENSSIKTATKLVEYQHKKFIEHLKKNIDAATNSCYTEPRDWDDFVNNYNSINDAKYFI